MSGQRDAPRMAGMAVGRCDDCGKFSYLTRQDAKVQARRATGQGHMTPYQCPHNDNWWHFGHLSASVKSGEIDRVTYEDNTRGRQIRAVARIVGDPVVVTIPDPRDAALIVDALEAAAHALRLTDTPRLAAKFQRLADRFGDALEKAAVPPCNGPGR